MAEIYKIYCKAEKDGEPIGADVVIRGVESPERALAATTRYFNDEQPFLGITVSEGMRIGFAEMTEEERAFYGHPSLQAIGEMVTLVAFYESNPAPDPDFYPYR